MTQLTTGTKPLTMRITFSDGLRYAQLNLIVDTLDGLLFMFEAGGQETKLKYGGSSRGVIGFERVDVLSISYNSPLEIVLGFSAGSGAVAFAANRILSVYRNVQKARVGRAEADVAAYTRTSSQKSFAWTENSWKLPTRGACGWAAQFGPCRV